MARTPRTLETLLPGEYPKRFNKRELKVMEALAEDDNIDEAFDAPLVWSAVDQEGALLATSTPAAGDEIAFRTRKNTFLAHVQSINGTPVHSFPFVSADGLEVNTDDDVTNGILGWEITNGILTTGYAAYTVGSFPQAKTVMFETTITIDDVSDVTTLSVGWRKCEAFQAAYASYTDFALIQKDGDENIDLVHDLNDSGSPTTTDTTLNWADGEEKTLRVEVDNDGSVRFYVAGTEYTSSAPFTFDSGDAIMPFFHLVAETGDPGVSVSAWKVGVK